MPNACGMDDDGVAVRQTHRFLLVVLAVIGAAIVAAVGLLVWGAHSSTHEQSSALDQAIGPLVSAMPSDARPLKNVARSDYRLRTYRVPTDVPTTETELVAAFHRARLNAVGEAVFTLGRRRGWGHGAARDECECRSCAHTSPGARN